ncbi:hypothetical protein BC828DRAFT_404484 [Blastocladiella britannica]|nr:hypothetical protein BC828DRAFT_404484 [Blastocladiella britannica]
MSSNTKTLPDLFLFVCLICLVFCIADLYLIHYGGFFRHSLYIVGATFVMQGILVLFCAAALLVGVASSNLFRAGRVAQALAPVRNPLKVIASYVAVILVARGYQLV